MRNCFLCQKTKPTFAKIKLSHIARSDPRTGINNAESMSVPEGQARATMEQRTIHHGTGPHGKGKHLWCQGEAGEGCTSKGNKSNDPKAKVLILMQDQVRPPHTHTSPHCPCRTCLRSNLYFLYFYGRGSPVDSFKQTQRP